MLNLIPNIPATKTGTSADDAPPPIRHDEEWANALTHGLGAIVSGILGALLLVAASSESWSVLIALAIYVTTTFLTYLFSSLSHTMLQPPLVNRLRAWDQAMIYLMIAGTYTPFAVKYAPSSIGIPVLAAIWVTALAGFLSKVGLNHRVNSAGTISYLLLGYLPAIPLAQFVPVSISAWVVVGGLIYTLGVVFLINDYRFRYLHALWHICVIAASACHYIGMLKLV